MSLHVIKPLTDGEEAKRGAVGECGEEKRVRASVLMLRSDIATISVSLYQIMSIFAVIVR
jgi:hypothetical protein